MPEEHQEVHQINHALTAEVKGVLDSWVVKKEVRGVPAPCETSPRTIATPPGPAEYGGLTPRDMMMLEDMDREGVFDPLGGLREAARGMKDGLEDTARKLTSGSSYGIKALSRDPFSNNQVPGIDNNLGYNVEKNKRGPGRPPKKKDFLI